MVMKARQFRIELGINLNAAPIKGSALSSKLYSLQNAPIDMSHPGSPTPVWWTRFEPGDEFTIRLVDITILKGPTPDPFNFMADISFNGTDPSTGSEVQPLTEPAGAWTVSSTVESLPSPVYSPNQALPTRTIYPENSSGPDGRVTLAAAGSYPFRFEFSGEVTVEIDGHTRHYVFDPEMIICDAGSGSGC